MEEKSGFDSKTVLALLICLGFWFAWQKHLESKYPHTNTRNSKQTENAVGENAKQVEVARTVAPATTLKEKALPTKLPLKATPRIERVFENDRWRVHFDSLGGVVSKVVIKNFKEGKKFTDIVVFGNSGLDSALNIFTEGKRQRDFSKANFEIVSTSERDFVLEAVVDGQKVRKTLSFQSQANLARVTVEVSEAIEETEQISVLMSKAIPEKNGSSSFLSFAPPSNESYQEYFFKYKNKNDRSVITHDETPAKKFEQITVASMGDRYFTTLFINKSNVLPNVETYRDQNSSVLKLSYPVLDKNNVQSLAFDYYSGQKSVPELKKIDESLSDVVDLGMFSIIALPLLSIMKWFHGIVGNYGIAIILLTILVRLITFPFTYASYKSMKAMQKIQPLVAQLKEKYKGNTQTFNIEVMKLYKENKVNPMGGCLPMLLQLPVFWALYQVLQNSIELYKAPFYFWISDLSLKDPYYILPVLMGASMFAQQKMTPTTMDPAQAKVMLFMPIFFSFLMLGLPSGLTLYIFVSTLFGIGQQIIMMKDKPMQTAIKA